MQGETCIEDDASGKKFFKLVICNIINDATVIDEIDYRPTIHLARIAHYLCSPSLECSKRNRNGENKN